MIEIKEVENIEGDVIDVTIPSKLQRTIDGKGLLLLPALIDPHVHFRQPGHGYKEDWVSGAQASFAGGVTTVFDMPNNDPPCITYEHLQKKKEMIEKQLREVDIPLRYHLYIGADTKHFSELPKVKREVVGIKVFMGCSTGNMLLDKQEDLEEVFRIAAKEGMIVSVHAEDEKMIQWNKLIYPEQDNPSIHSKIRGREAAIIATRRALDLAATFHTKLCILHMSTKEEVALVRDAKRKELPVFAEAAPHHLFLNESAYQQWGTKVQMNPPLRKEDDQIALWEGIRDGTIDCIGTDHAPHLLAEKKLPYGQAPSGVPSIELYLPLLLHAYHEGKITLKKIVEVTRTNIERFFSIPSNEDVVLVDLYHQQPVKDSMLKTKCQWSPYNGMVLRGWPVFTICRDHIYEIRERQCI